MVAGLDGFEDALVAEVPVCFAREEAGGGEGDDLIELLVGLGEGAQGAFEDFLWEADGPPWCGFAGFGNDAAEEFAVDEVGEAAEKEARGGDEGDGLFGNGR